MWAWPLSFVFYLTRAKRQKVRKAEYKGALDDKQQITYPSLGLANVLVWSPSVTGVES